MPGPPKTPLHLRLVRDNPSKRPINGNEPKPAARVPPVAKANAVCREGMKSKKTANFTVECGLQSCFRLNGIILSQK